MKLQEHFRIGGLSQISTCWCPCSSSRLGVGVGDLKRWLITGSVAVTRDFASFPPFELLSSNTTLFLFFQLQQAAESTRLQKDKLPGLDSLSTTTIASCTVHS